MLNRKYIFNLKCQIHVTLIKLSYQLTANICMYGVKILTFKFYCWFNFVGFVTSKVACCGQGPYNGVGVCRTFSNLCPNRNLYAFWDQFHPSEKANRIIVHRIMSGSTRYMKPMNLSTILALDATTWIKSGATTISLIDKC